MLRVTIPGLDSSYGSLPKSGSCVASRLIVKDLTMILSLFSLFSPPFRLSFLQLEGEKTGWTKEGLSLTITLSPIPT